MVFMALRVGLQFNYTHTHMCALVGELDVQSQSPTQCLWGDEPLGQSAIGAYNFIEHKIH